MKKPLFMLCFLLAVISCKKEKPACMPYGQAIKEGRIPFKTSTLQLSDSLYYTLEYVRDQEYKETSMLCFGNLELNGTEFAKAAATITTKYKPSAILMLDLMGENSDLCHNEPQRLENIKSYMVYYRGKNDILMLDYTDIATGKTETYPVSEAYATVKMYFLMERSGIKKNPSLIELTNMDFDVKRLKLIKQSADTLYLKIHHRL